ncbi:MAG: DUF4325 domain-containing protein [Gemmatimonadetes bacterium]|nr:DUF4325 domain-containing protein [Gemmatimonadota bacterium]MYG21010.1 DUF4325 domain-containing protein [Gemmatimonadota bacterium]MYJ38024.1 DUF4325 domain-containing protein [Gemmatimonadota bacterium]
MGEVEHRDGHVVVGASVGPPDTHRLCAGLHQAAQRGNARITLDFSACTGITQAVMLPLMPIVTTYRERRGVVFRLLLPSDDGLSRLFVNTNWAHHIDPDAFQPNVHEGGHVPALRFEDDGANGQDAILVRVMELILRNLDTSRDTLKAVEWSLGEIMENVPIHAESPVGGFVQATAYSGGNAVEFVVADGGIGIPASMGAADDQSALTDAITEGVTRDPKRNAGNGLFGSYQVAVLSDGVFELRSGWGLLRRIGDGDLRTEPSTAPYPGTSVRCRIGLGDPGLLARALRFRGQSHDPPHDYLQREYEDNHGAMIVNMKKKASLDFGSRRGGRRMRRMVRNLLVGHPSVVLDFDGVGIITSSFADEFFGRLFVAMGPRAFMTRIRMINVDLTVEGLIDRAILQRSRLGNSED